MSKSRLTRAGIFRQCAALIQERGLAKGSAYDLEGRVCAMGAINCALMGDPGLGPGLTMAGLERRNRLAGFVERMIGLPRNGLARWNDAPHRTKSEVVAAFRKAARLAARKRVSR